MMHGNTKIKLLACVHISRNTGVPRKRCCTWRMLWAVHPWLWPVSLRMLRVVRQNEIRQRRKLVDRALCCVCSAINEYAHGRTTMGRRALPLTTGRAWKSLEFFTLALRKTRLVLTLGIVGSYFAY